MAKRGDSPTADLKVRMKEPLRAAIEAAATANGVSMNAEAVARLQRTFSDDEAMGGQAIVNIVHELVISFGAAGENAARAAGHAWTAGEWLKDADCYREAVASTVAALLVRSPDWKSKSGRNAHFNAIKSWVAFHDANYPATED